MKKLFTLAAVAAMAFSVCAQETSSKEDDRDPLEETEEEEDALDITEVEPPHKKSRRGPCSSPSATFPRRRTSSASA